MQHDAIGNGGREWAFQATRPDYHLTPERPLWAETYWHPTAKNPVLSIHSGLEIGIVVSGWQEIELDGSQISGNPGDVWLCAMSEPHRYRVVLPDTRNLVFIFLPSFFGEETLGEISWLTLFAAPPRERPQVSTPQTRHQVLTTAKELERTLAERQTGWESLVRLDLLRLLFYLSRGWKRSSGASHTTQAFAGNLSRIMPALTLLSERTPHLLSRDEAAGACGLGRSRFTMLFRETMGVSFQTFRRRARVAYAATMLVTTSLPTEAIAERAAFSDASHLHRAFVQEYECTPGQYRDQAQAGSRRGQDT